MVSERDRAYMRRIAVYKADSHAEAKARHLALPLGERLRRSCALYLAGREVARPTDRDDDPTHFYERARKRGLYQP